MTESYRRNIVEKNPSISSINININMNVQPPINSHHNSKSSQMNGKKIGQANDIELMSKDHLFSMRPNISTQSLARNKKLFMQNMSMNFNQKQSNKKPHINIDYNDQYLETFNHDDEVQFQLYNNSNSLTCSKHKPSQKDDKTKLYSNVNFNKKTAKNVDFTYNNSHTLKKQINNTKGVRITQFDNKNAKRKSNERNNNKSKSKSKSKQFSRSKSKQFSRSKSISPTKSIKSNKQKSIQLILNKSKEKRKGKDPQKSISISRQLQRENKNMNVHKQKEQKKRKSSKSKQKIVQKCVSKSGQKSKKKSKSKQKINSKSKQKYSLGLYVKKKTSPLKQIKESHNNSKMNKTQKLNHKNSKILATKTTSTNFYRPQKQGNIQILEKKNKNLSSNNQSNQRISKNKQEKKINSQLKSVKKFNPKKYLVEYKNPELVSKVIFIQKMWKGYWIRKVFGQQLKQINKRVKKVQTSISKKSAKYWNSNKSSINSVQNIEQFQIDRNQVLVQRQKEIEQMLLFRKPNKLLQKPNSKNINFSDSSFASQKISMDRSQLEIQKLREKVNEECLKNQKLLEQNQKLKQHILSVSAKSKSQKSSSYGNSPPDSENISLKKQEEKHLIINKQFTLQPQNQSSQHQNSIEKQLKRQEKMILLPTIKLNVQSQKQNNRFSLKDQKLFEKLQLVSQKKEQKQPINQKNIQVQHETYQQKTQIKVEKAFNIIDMSPVIKTQEHEIQNLVQANSKTQKNLKNLFLDIEKVETENNSYFQNSLKKKFQFYECSPRSNSNINVSSIIQTGEYQKKVIQCRILQQQFQRKVRLLNQIKRDNLISPKSFDIKIINLSKQYQNNKKIIDEEIINSSRSCKSDSSSKFNIETQNQPMFLKTVEKKISEQKQNISIQYKKNSISKYLNFQNQKKQKVLINNETSFEVHENQNKFRLSSEEDQANSQRNQANNQEEESFSKFFQRLSKQQNKKQDTLIEQIQECDILRKQGEKRIMQIMNLSPQNQNQQSQNLPNQMVSPSNQSVFKPQPKNGFETHLLYVKNLIFQFFDFIRKSPKFQRQITENLLCCPYSLQDFLKTYRTRFNQISDIYLQKQEGNFQIFSYFRYLIDMKPIISSQVFQYFEDLRLPIQISGQMDASMNISQNGILQQNEQVEKNMLKRIFNMFLFDVLNQAFQEERVDLMVCKGLSVNKPQLVNFFPIAKSLQIFNQLQMMGYNLNQVNMRGQQDDQQQEYSLQKYTQQQIQIKKLLKQKGSLLDIIICNIVKKILQHWGRCLCGIIIQEAQGQKINLSSVQLNLKRQERMAILLEKYLHDNESNLDLMLKQYQIWVKLSLQDLIFKDLVRQFTQQLNILEQKNNL